MDSQTLTYKLKTAMESDIYTHLYECKNQFIPPLDETIQIQKYAKKLFEKSFTFEAWADRILTGLIAAYFNDPQKITGYITNISIRKEYTGRGIASHLLQECITHAQKLAFSEVKLEVNAQNSPAVHLYKKFGFYLYDKKADSLFMKRNISD